MLAAFDPLLRTTHTSFIFTFQTVYNAEMLKLPTNSVEEMTTPTARSSQPRKTPVDVKDEGFTVLWEGQDPVAE